MDKKNNNLISSINFWKNEIDISPIKGGITNKNFLVDVFYFAEDDMILTYGLLTAW